jgi:hypothetical protein
MMIKWRRTRWTTGTTTRIQEKRMCANEKERVGKKRGDKLEDDIKMVLKEAGWKYLDLNSCNSGYRQIMGSCQQGTDPSGTSTAETFLTN